MRYLRYLITIVALGCLAVHTYALDDEQGYLDPANPDENAYAKHQIKNTMQSDIFNANSKGSSFTTSLGPKSSDMRREKGTISSLSSNSGFSETAANLAGSWSLDLRDASARTLSLNLLQSGSMVFGKGTMTSSEGGSQEIAATGTVEGAKIYLDILSMKDVGLFKLGLSLSESSLTGSYDAYSASKAPVAGTASGSISRG